MATHHTTNLPYTPIPSAFTCVEKPLRYVYDQYEPLLHNNALRMYLAGMVVYPLTVCATPVTVVADMVIGAVECTFCILSRGDNLRDVAELAKKKIIISPLHHLIFVICSLEDSAFVSLLLSYRVLSVKFCLVLFTKVLWVCSFPIISLENAKKIHSMPNNLISSYIFENRMLYIAFQTTFVVKASWDFISLLSSGGLTIPKIVIPIAITSLYWIFNYTFSQRMVGSFSPSWNHQVFSIFRDRGAPVKDVGTGCNSNKDLDPNITLQDLAFTDCSVAFWQAHSPESFEASPPNRNQLPREASAIDWKSFWANFINEDRGKIDPTYTHKKPLYNQFREDVLAGKPAIELLKLPQNPSKIKVETAYKIYSLALHPDVNCQSDEATILFKCLDQAKYQLIGD